MTHFGSISRPLVAYFEHALARGDDYLDVEVTYNLEYDEVSIDDVTHDGQSIETTVEEDNILYQIACDLSCEAFIDAQASYGDYLADLRRDD
jgi:hypothetical protein